MNNRILSHKPPRIAMLFLVLAAGLHWLRPLRGKIVMPSVYVAVSLGLGGFWIMMLAWWQFRQNDVAICPTAPTERLLTNGVYRVTRNPMYLGIVLMLIAVAIQVGSLPFVAAAIGYFAVIHLVFCPYEERKLAATFGKEYRDYQVRVGRWI